MRRAGCVGAHLLFVGLLGGDYTNSGLVRFLSALVVSLFHSSFLARPGKYKIGFAPSGSVNEPINRAIFD
jgi:hypothetical protein